MKRILILFILIFIALSFVHAQKRVMRKADKILDTEDIPAALKEYKKLHEAMPDNIDITMRLGYCYLRSPNIADSSIVFIQQAVDNYRTLDNPIKFNEAYFYLGQAYRKQHDFDHALKIFNELKDATTDKPEFQTEVQQEINFCESGKKLVNNKTAATVKNLKNLNSTYSEHSPYLTDAETAIVFTSRQPRGKADVKQKDGQYFESIFMSKIVNGEWIAPSMVSKKIVEKGHIADCSITADGKKMYVYKDGNIWETLNEGGEWGNMKKTKIPINSGYIQEHLCETPDGKTIYFCSNQAGGFGGLDIYKIEKDDAGNWGKEINLGQNVNTEYDELGAFVHPDGTLYFSSEGHNSMGGFDFFSCTPDGNGNFNKAENLGYPTNSVDDDVFIYITENKKSGYFASSRKGGQGNMDIFYVNYADSSKYYLTVRGQVKKENGKKGDIFLNVIDTKTKQVVQKIPVAEDGTYAAVVKKGEDYTFVYEAAGHFFENRSLKTKKDTTTVLNENLVVLDEMKTGKIKKTYETDFEKKKQKPDDENEVFLSTLSTFMEKNPELVLNISMTNTETDKKSNKRIEKIIDYLEKSGLDSKKIFIDMVDAGKDENTAYITVMDNTTQEIVNNQKIKEADTEELAQGEGLFINYTVQVGAFSKSINPKDKFFAKLNYEVNEYFGNDKLYRYSYGGYKFKSEAQKQMIILQKMGYKDAFVREIKWYKKAI